MIILPFPHSAWGEGLREDGSGPRLRWLDPTAGAGAASLCRVVLQDFAQSLEALYSRIWQ